MASKPPAKKLRLSLPKPKPDGPQPAQEKRFSSPNKSLESYQEGFVPKNTEINTTWALRTFNEWRDAYNLRHPELLCPADLLLSGSSKDISFWLQKYILSTRKKSGDRYPPKTLYLLLCGLNRYMKQKLQSINIFDRGNPDFKLLFNTCDSLFRELREDGVGNDSKHTEPLTREDEIQLWSLGVLSASTPRGLLNAVFFLNGKNFALRGGAEHRCLKVSQIVSNLSPEGKLRYTYTENCSKNRAGGFNQLNVPNKVVHSYEDLEAGERCHVYILNKYISKIPPSAYDQDIFYLRPVSKMPTTDTAPWYISVPIGKNPLSKMLKTMCEEAGIHGNKTNHSLRAYAATELFSAGIPENVIQDRTGHRSLEGLRKYERISEKQKEEASKVLTVKPTVKPTEPAKVMTQLNVAEDQEPPSTAHHSCNYSMQRFQVNSKQQQPTFSFGSSHMQGRTINICQSPPNNFTYKENEVTVSENDSERSN